MVNTKSKYIDKLSAIEYTVNMEQRIVKIAALENEKVPFIEWLNSLDKTAKARIQSRLTRLLENNFGDHKKIDNVIVLLINGGDKSTQQKDIEKAKNILQEWRKLQ